MRASIRLFKFAIVISAVASFAAWSSSPAVAVPQCLGKPATIVGTSGNNTLEGTRGNDVIVGRGGNDDILGKGGRDRICGGGGTDTMRAGPGNDRMDGGLGPDEFFGQAGTDWAVYAGRQSKVDIVIDDDANDGAIDAGGGVGEGDFVSPATENAIGGDAGDGFVGGVLLDIDQVFRGGPGADNGFGGGGDDRLFGEAGDDDLNGQDGDADFADGGPGNADQCVAEEVVNCEIV